MPIPGPIYDAVVKGGKTFSNYFTIRKHHLDEKQLSELRCFIEDSDSEKDRVLRAKLIYIDLQHVQEDVDKNVEAYMQSLSVDDFMILPYEKQISILLQTTSMISIPLAIKFLFEATLKENPTDETKVLQKTLVRFLAGKIEAHSNKHTQYEHINTYLSFAFKDDAWLGAYSEEDIQKVFDEVVKLDISSSAQVAVLFDMAAGLIGKNIAPPIGTIEGAHSP